MYISLIKIIHIYPRIDLASRSYILFWNDIKSSMKFLYHRAKSSICRKTKRPILNERSNSASRVKTSLGRGWKQLIHRHTCTRSHLTKHVTPQPIMWLFLHEVAIIGEEIGRLVKRSPLSPQQRACSHVKSIVMLLIYMYMYISVFIFYS